MALNDLEHASSVLDQPESEKTDAYSQPPLKKQSEDEDGGIPSPPKAYHANFPDGGLKAWSVVAGTACLLFCNFGYANAFG